MASFPIPSADLEEVVHCPLCQNNEAEIRFKFDPPFRVVQCKSCGFYYLSPRLSESAIQSIYESDDYFQSHELGYENYQAQEHSLRLTYRRLIHTLQRNGLTGGKLLEVGCGYGFLLSEAKGCYSWLAGTEFSKAAADQARQIANCIYLGGTEAVPQHERFNTIIATQVIEHVYQPREFLARLKQHLEPEGPVVIATPDMGSFWRKLMGARWPSFKIPEHVLYLEHWSLKQLLLEAGFQNIRSIPYPHAFPLSLVAEKLGIRQLPKSMGHLAIWLPKTTFALTASVKDVS